MPVRAAALSVATGAALLVGAPAWWYASVTPAEAGDPTAIVSTSGPTPGKLAAPAIAEPDESAAVRSLLDRAVVVVDDPGRPTRLRIAELDVDAPLDAVGLEDDGAMELPDDVQRVGWYELGVRPGEAGSAVLAGHVDSRTTGRGALFDLRRLDPGATVEVELADGTVQRWEVVARTRHGRDELPIDELFRWDGPQQLTIITCGGDFDPVTGSYAENVVIHAAPASA